MTDKHFPDLTDQQRARIWAAGSDISEMAVRLRAGTATPDDVAGALGRLFSTDDNRDALRLPPDAGVHAECLERILRRIRSCPGRGVNTEHGRRFRFTTCKSAKKESRPCLFEYQPSIASAPESMPYLPRIGSFRRSLKRLPGWALNC